MAEFEKKLSMDLKDGTSVDKEYGEEFFGTENKHNKDNRERNKVDEFKKVALELAIKNSADEKKHDALDKIADCVSVEQAGQKVDESRENKIISKKEAEELLNILGSNGHGFMSDERLAKPEILVQPESRISNPNVPVKLKVPDVSEVIALPIIPKKLEIGTDEKPPEIKKLHVINIDEIVERYARTIAKEKTRELLHRPEENMTSDSRAKSMWNHIRAPFFHPIKFAQKSWVRLMEAGYEEKFYQEALKKITDNQNLLLEFDPSARLRKDIDAKAGDKYIHYEILDKIIEQYSNEVAELEEQGNPIASLKVDAEFKGLIAKYYLGGWERPEFEKKLKDLINDLKKNGHIKNADFLGKSGRNKEEVSEGRMYASNLWETVESYKIHIEEKVEEIKKEHNLDSAQEEKLREHLAKVMELDIQLGAKISDIHNRRPQGTLNATDRLISWTQRAPILGRIAPNPGTMAFIGAGVGAFVGRRLTSKTAIAGVATIGLATGAWAPVIGAGVIAGTFGALRRNLELKKDRAMHQQQRVLGKEYKDYRRKNMENYQYDVKSTAEIRKQLDLIEKAGEYAKLSSEQKKELADMLARFKLEVNYDREYRTEKKPNRTVDLISVPAEEGEMYGTTLMSKTELKKKLYGYLRANDLMKGADHQLSGDPEFKDLFRKQYDNLDENIAKADKSFDWHRRRSALLIGALTAVSGSVAAVAGQEFMGFLRVNGGNNYTALDSLRDLWREHVSGKPTKMSETVSRLFFQGKDLLPGENKINLDGKDIKLFVIMDPKTGIPKIDESKLPVGFTLSSDGNQLLHQIPGSREMKEFTNWQEFSKTLGYSTDQKISYGEGFYQKTAPEKNIRARVESWTNLFHNRKLNANYTELMMAYKQDENGKVIVDASKIIGKELFGRSGGDSVNFEEALKSGKVFLNLARDNEISGGDGSQFNPIMLKMNEDGTVEVPEKLAKVFFGFDKDGKLLQGSGNHPGLHQLVLDTGKPRQDGSKIVRGIAATLGEKPEMEAEVIIPGKTETFDFNLEQGKQFNIPYVAPALAHGPRWQLEDVAKKKEEGSKNKEGIEAGHFQEEAGDKQKDSQDTPHENSDRKKSVKEKNVAGAGSAKSALEKIKERSEAKLDKKEEEDRKKSAEAEKERQAKEHEQAEEEGRERERADEIAVKELGISAKEFKMIGDNLLVKKFSNGELIGLITKILGIPNKFPTNKAAIKKAYRKKCLEWHPDMENTEHGLEVNNVKFILINNLYSDYQRRFIKKNKKANLNN